jgi:cytochrome P450
MVATVLRSLPGPATLPKVGPIANLIKFFINPIPTLYHHYKTYGPVSNLGVKLFYGADTVLAIGPEYNQQVLSNPKAFYSIQYESKEDTAASRLTSGVVYLNGEQAREQRRLIMPAFHKKEIDNYANQMIAVTERFLNGWHIGESVNVHAEMVDLTMAIVVKTLFGLDYDERGRALGVLLEKWLGLNNGILTMMIPKAIPGSPAQRLLVVAEKIEAIIKALLEEKRPHLAESHDVLSMLMRANDEDGTRMTDTQVIGNTAVMYLAGHETSANALSWALFLLSQHPKVAADLMDELDANLHGEPPTLENLGNLRLLDAVINESLRLFPPLSYIPRIVHEPCQVGGYDIPKDTAVMISHYMTHRLPEIYAQPDRFNPERWFTINPSPYEYIPFSAGPRMCIGATFAMMEMRIVLAMLLQRYRLSVVPEKAVNASIMFLLRAKQIPMLINQQDRKFTKDPIHGSVTRLVDLS